MLENLWFSTCKIMLSFQKGYFFFLLIWIQLVSSSSKSVLLVIYLFVLFYCCSSSVVSNFISLHHPAPHPSPTIEPTLFGFGHVSFIHVPWWPSPCFSSLSFPLLLPGYCQFLLHFKVSGCIFLACLFGWLGSTYRWDHMVFVIHCLSFFYC